MQQLSPAFTHMGIYTDRPEAMRDFYVAVLRLVVSDSGRGMLFPRRIIFLTGDPKCHHQFVLVAREGDDPPGGALFQASFKVQSLDELRAVTARAEAHGAREIVGMNHGNSWSVYFRDPDNNRVEIYMDTDWYVPQPYADLLDLTQSDAEIRAVTNARAGKLAGALPVAAWNARIDAEIAAHRAAGSTGHSA